MIYKSTILFLIFLQHFLFIILNKSVIANIAFQFEIKDPNNINFTNISIICLNHFDNKLTLTFQTSTIATEFARNPCPNDFYTLTIQHQNQVI